MVVRPLEDFSQNPTSAMTATVASIMITLKITRVLGKSALRASGRVVWTFSQRKFSPLLNRNPQNHADCVIVNFMETTVIANT